MRDLLDFSIYLDISDEVKFAWKIQVCPTVRLMYFFFHMSHGTADFAKINLHLCRGIWQSAVTALKASRLVSKPGNQILMPSLVLLFTN